VNKTPACVSDAEPAAERHDAFTDDHLSDAIVVWTGYRRSSWPDRHETRLIERFGQDATTELLPRIQAMQDDEVVPVVVEFEVAVPRSRPAGW
jgi:hypothetical protein